MYTMSALDTRVPSVFGLNRLRSDLCNVEVAGGLRY